MDFSAFLGITEMWRREEEEVRDGETSLHCVHTCRLPSLFYWHGLKSHATSGEYFILHCILHLQTLKLLLTNLQLSWHLGNSEQ